MLLRFRLFKIRSTCMKSYFIAYLSQNLSDDYIAPLCLISRPAYERRQINL